GMRPEQTGEMTLADVKLAGEAGDRPIALRIFRDERLGGLDARIVMAAKGDPGRSLRIVGLAMKIDDEELGDLGGERRSVEPRQQEKRDADVGGGAGAGDDVAVRYEEAVGLNGQRALDQREPI